MCVCVCVCVCGGGGGVQVEGKEAEVGATGVCGGGGVGGGAGVEGRPQHTRLTHSAARAPLSLYGLQYSNFEKPVLH